MTRRWGSTSGPPSVAAWPAPPAASETAMAGVPLGFDGRARNASHLAEGVRELGHDEPLHGEAHGRRRAGQEEHERVADDARVGAREHRGGADLREGQRAKELSEAVEPAREQRADRL